ncbi:MAG TPA: hypothetical protein VHV55_05680 [Pirellulales bacterium]|jgi:hypothetical protein|nr:hypothetical protein [Pirellulales bacterium]
MQHANGQSPRSELDKLREELLRRIIKNEEQRKQRLQVAGK